MDKQIQEKIFQIGENAFQMMVEKEFYSSIASALIVFIVIGGLLWGLKYAIAGLKKAGSYDKDEYQCAIGVCLFALAIAISIFVHEIFCAVYPEATVLHDVFGKTGK